MNRNQLAFFLTIVCLGLAACDRPSALNGGGGGGGGTGTATVSVMLTAQPEAPSATHTTLALTTTITGVTLNPSAGNPVTISLNPAAYPVEFLNTQSGGAFMGTATLPTGSYDSVTVTFGASKLTFYNTSGGAISTCPNNSQCKVTPTQTVSSVQISGTPLFTVTSGEQTGIALRLILANALTFANGTATVNYGAMNAFHVVALPRHSPTLAAGQLDTIENFTGQITALSGTSITLQNGFGVPLTAKIGATVTVNDPQGVCRTVNISCLALNQTVSIDAGLNLDGSLSLLEADVLDTTAKDELEGTLFYLNPNLYTLVVSNKINATNNAALTAVALGDLDTLTLANNATFLIDSEDIPTAQFPAITNFFQSTGNFYSGQALMAHVSSMTGVNATTDQVRLRFSNLSGTVPFTPGSESFVFTASTISPQLFTLQLSNVTQPTVQAFQLGTLVDGISALSSIAPSDSVSVRGIFLPTAPSDFYVAKVRDTTSE